MQSLNSILNVDDNTLPCGRCNILLAVIQRMNKGFQKEINRIRQESGLIKLAMQKQNQSKNCQGSTLEFSSEINKNIKLTTVLMKKQNDLEVDNKSQLLQVQAQINIQRAIQQTRQKDLQKKFAEAIEFKVWSDLESQLWLNAYACGLEELPKKLCLLSQLQYLYVWGNKLSFLPQEIGSLRKLKYLWMQKNKELITLPKSFSAFKELNSLALDLHLLPQENIFASEPFCSLSSLETLNVYFESAEQARLQRLKIECRNRKLFLRFNNNIVDYDFKQIN